MFNDLDSYILVYQIEHNEIYYGHPYDDSFFNKLILRQVYIEIVLDYINILEKKLTYIVK